MSDPKLNIVITVDGKQYHAELDKGEQHTKEFGVAVDKAGEQVDKLAVDLKEGGAAAKQFGDKGQKSGKHTRAFGNTVDKTGTKVDKLSVDLKEGGGAARRFGNQSQQSAAKVEHMAGKAKLAAAAIVGLIAALGVRDVILVNAEFEKLSASLRVVTGSTVGADAALSMIVKKAAETPYSVRQLTESFIKLKAMGLDPSAEALTSYGNTASAMGRDLNQMVEAVADAVTGEFERLKEFGIMARTHGERIKFTFQSVTTEVGKNSKEIQDYLLSIGNTNFSGAMAEQMGTLGGKFSNLGDATDRLMVALGDAGLTKTTKTLTDALISLVSTASEFVEIYGEFKEDPFSDQVVAIRDYREEMVGLLATYGAQQQLLDRAIEGGANEQVQTVLRGNIKGLLEHVTALKSAINTLQSGVDTERSALSDNSTTPAAAANDGQYDAHLQVFEEYWRKRQEISDRNIQQVESSFFNEEQRLGESYARRAQMVMDSMVPEERKRELLLQLEAKFQNDMNKLRTKDAVERERIEKKSAAMVEAITDKTTDMKWQAAQLAVSFVRMVASDSKAVAVGLIAVEKGLAIARVVVNTEVASMRAMSDLGPIFGPPVVAALQAQRAMSIGIITATGLMEMHQSTSGGAIGGSSGGNYSAENTTPSDPAGAAANQPSYNDSNDIVGELHLYSDDGYRYNLSFEQLEQTVEYIEDITSRGGRVVVHPSSRNGRMLRGAA